MEEKKYKAGMGGKSEWHRDTTFKKSIWLLENLVVWLNVSCILIRLCFLDLWV